MPMPSLSMTIWVSAGVSLLGSFLACMAALILMRSFSAPKLPPVPDLPPDPSARASSDSSRPAVSLHKCHDVRCQGFKRHVCHDLTCVSCDRPGGAAGPPAPTGPAHPGKG